MRALIEEQIRNRKLPLVMAHKCGMAYGLENSVQALRTALQFKPDIIEIDVRKSRDGVLYGHHGSIPFGVIAATFFGVFTFSQIQKLVGHRDTLDVLLKEIPLDTLVYLDLKDSWITADDLRPFIADRKGVWLGPYGSIKWLKRLRAELGEEFSYSLNRPPLLFPQSVAKQLFGHVDLIALFRWSWKTKIVESIEATGLLCYSIDWFTSRKKYIAELSISRYSGFFFSVYDLAEANQLQSMKTRLKDK